MTTEITLGSREIISPPDGSAPGSVISLTEEKSKTTGVASNFFARTGTLSCEDFQWSEQANPRYAIWNCQQTSITTARMLETGEKCSVSTFPIISCQLSEVVNRAFSPSNEKRSFAYFKFDSLDNLRNLMLQLGWGVTN